MAAIEAHITGTVWKVEVQIGDRVEEGDTVVVLESMKMEMPVEAEEDGEVREVLVEEGQAVNGFATSCSASSANVSPARAPRS